MIDSPEHENGATRPAVDKPPHGITTVVVVPAEQLIDMMLPAIRSAMWEVISEAIIFLIIGALIAGAIRERYNER
ncbi:MAG TPA: hypothetical protein VGO07_03745 [Candidatus Saccharimonadales bacterium]|jgi:hypothetical protein|nr:hypothetical protein [Candidatus Saccharimonadales bacterium]